MLISTTFTINTQCANGTGSHKLARNLFTVHGTSPVEMQSKFQCTYFQHIVENPEAVRTLHPCQIKRLTFMATNLMKQQGFLEVFLHGLYCCTYNAVRSSSVANDEIRSTMGKGIHVTLVKTEQHSLVIRWLGFPDFRYHLMLYYLVAFLWDRKDYKRVFLPEPKLIGVIR